MTATATPTNQAVTEWVKLFPRQLTENYTSSVTFMKQLTVVAISTITYLKNAFPEDSYTVETFAGAKLRILKKKCRDDVAHFLSTALTQAFEAFDKKYLHQLVLCFYEDDCKIENLVEYHIFEYSYNDDGVSMNVHSKNRNNVTHTMKYSFESVRERTIHLVRAYIVLMQSCQNELPSSYDVSLRLYYNEDAPADYQAPGYQNAGEDDHLAGSLRETVKVGWVETPYHKLATRCYMKEYFGGSHEAIPSQNAPFLSNEMDLSEPRTESISEINNQVVCPCNKYDLEENGMLTCQYCNTQQHAACFGMLRATPDVQHCCTTCSDDDKTRTPTDARIAALKGRKRECLSIFRRTLYFCSQMPRLCMTDFKQKFNMTEANAFKLARMLYSHGILKNNPDIDSAPQKVISENLKAIQAKYFHTKEDNIVDRLLAETFSQESLTDPINEVLSPLEKVSLNMQAGNTLTNDTILKDRLNILKDGNTDLNVTLQEYRDALPVDNISEPDSIAQTIKTTVKRKSNENNKPSLRLGVRTKRARALPK